MRFDENSGGGICLIGKDQRAVRQCEAAKENASLKKPLGTASHFLPRMILMDTDENNNNSNQETMGSQNTSAGMNSAYVLDAAQQSQASLSRFLQEDQRKDENLSRLMDHPSDQLSIIEREIDDVRQATERNLELIRNYRS
jgi:hypothetical protein